MTRPLREGLRAHAGATLVASWRCFALGSPGADVVDVAGATAARFPAEPAREVFNNALTFPGAPNPDALVAEVERVYADAGIARFALWVHESDAELLAHARRRGYVDHETTRQMGMHLADLTEVAPVPLDLVVEPSPAQMWRINGLAADVLPRLSTLDVLYVALVDDRPAVTALGFRHEGDCGVFNVATLPFARRRGLGAAITAAALSDARAAGCCTATLHATPMAEAMYAQLGFMDLGRVLELTPPP